MTDRESLPSSVMLPSGRVVGLVGIPEDVPIPTGAEGAPYADAVALLEKGGVILRGEGRPVDVRALLLSDFHGLRAILTRLGWLGERAVTIECRNCRATLSHRPCAALELGPFVDRELHHPELDARLALGATHPIPAVRVARTTASEITFRAVTLGDAAPLHAALGRRRLALDADVVDGLGVVALGAERGRARIARALARCSEAAFLEVESLFLDAHYSPRLFSVAKCPSCGARNDVDAPFDREFSARVDARGPLPGAKGAHPYRELRLRSARSEEPPPPTFEAFDARARELFAQVGGDATVALVVDGDVPACDEGGEPLLGSYSPPFEGDAATPSRSSEVTVYFRTFLAIWDESGPYDLDAELRETLEHELEHHAGHRRGYDAVDVEERRAIDHEAVDLIGARGTARLVVGSFGRDFAGFMRRTWPLWVLVVVGTAVTVVMGR